MGTAKVAISLDSGLLARIDVHAERSGKSRSEFVREGLEYVLRLLDEEREVQEARAIYAAIEDDEAMRQHEAMLGAATETLPPFDSTNSGARSAEAIG